MKSYRRRFSSNRGWALITVIVLSAIMLLLGGSILSYTATERRLNEQHRLQLKARNMSENIANFAAEQLTQKLMRTRSASQRQFTGTDPIYLPSSSVLESATSDTADMEVFAGLESQTGFQWIDPVTNPTHPQAGLQVNTATAPILAKATFKHSAGLSATSYSNYDMSVALVPIFQFGMFFNMDLEMNPGGELTIAGPVHTNGRLAARSQHQRSNKITFAERVSAVEGLYATANLKVIAREPNGDASGGSPGDDNGGNGPVYFTNPSGVQTQLYNGSIWRDHKWGNATENATTKASFKTFAESTYGANLRTSLHGATKLTLPGVGEYKEIDDPATPGDDRNNGRQLIDPPVATDTSTLKAEKLAYRCGLYIVVNPDDFERSARLPNGDDVAMAAHSYRCWLNTAQNNGTYTLTEVVLPGQPSYGALNAIQNNLPNRFTNASYVGTNQVLRIPASGRAADAVMTQLNIPLLGAVPVSILRPVASGNLNDLRTGYDSGAPAYPVQIDGYFYDLRRATGNQGLPHDRAADRPYTPRAIAKIDFDMTRFKMALERTLYNSLQCDGTRPLYDVSSTFTSYTDNFSLIDRPANTTSHERWQHHILNENATPSSGAYTIRLGMDPTSNATFANPALADPAVLAQWCDPFRIYTTAGNPLGIGSFVTSAGASPWFDGIAVYIHSVHAEKKGDPTADANGRVDSAVRIINGRGFAPSLSGTDYPNKTGFTLVTNDALYIMGHFNAHGRNLQTDVTQPNYSGRYPSSNTEPLCSLMGDAITILTQPQFEGPNALVDVVAAPASASGTDNVSYGPNQFPVYSQRRGWSDALSHLRSVHGSSVDTAQPNNWRTTNPGSSFDGESAAVRRRPGILPNMSASSTVGPRFSAKAPPVTTEVSTAMVVGIVPSNHNPTGLIVPAPSPAANGIGSGGAYNFPRLLEYWSQSGTWRADRVENNNVDNDANGTSSALIIRGSMIAAFESRVAAEPWAGTRYYSAPARHWGLHEGFRQTGHDVPLEPIVLSTSRMAYRELTQAEYTARKAAIQALPAP